MNATDTVLTAAIETFDLGHGYHVNEETRLQLLAFVAALPELPTQTLDNVENWLRAGFGQQGWFVYRGGNHVALHRVSGGVRVLIVREDRVPPTPEALAAEVAANVAILKTVEQAAAQDDAKRFEPGDAFDVYANQGQREGTVLAVLGDEFLVEYTMPKGTTALQIFSTSALNALPLSARRDGDAGRSVSYRALPLKWLTAVVAADQGWVANPQGARRLPAPELVLNERLTKRFGI